MSEDDHDNFPVENVSGDEAEEILKRLNAPAAAKNSRVTYVALNMLTFSLTPTPIEHLAPNGVLTVSIPDEWNGSSEGCSGVPEAMIPLGTKPALGRTTHTLTP